MSAAEDRIRELAASLEPVRPIPPLWVAWAAAVGLAVVSLAAQWALGGSAPRVFDAAERPLDVATLAGIAVFGLAGIAAALASAVPGREWPARLGARVALVGLGVAVAAGLFGVLAADAPLARAELRACVGCIVHSLALGGAPALAVGAFVGCAAPRRPTRSAALVIGGAVAVGAAAVHATCASTSVAHWLLGHTLAPVVVAAVATLPLAALLARLARR